MNLPKKELIEEDSMIWVVMFIVFPMFLMGLETFQSSGNYELMFGSGVLGAILLIFRSYLKERHQN